MAAFAIRVGVALAVPGRGGRPAAATHSPVARLDRACLIAGRVVEVRLYGRRRAAEAVGDLGDREALHLAEVARQRNCATTLGHAVSSSGGGLRRHRTEATQR